MKNKRLEIFRLEDRVLFEAAAAAEIAEAADAINDLNANDAEVQADQERNSLKNASPENPADAILNAGEGMQDPAQLTDLEADINQLIFGEFAPIDGENDFLADMVNDIISQAFADQSDFVTMDIQNTETTVSTDRELVIINSSVPDADVILASLKPGQDVLMLEAGTDAMAAINEYLDTADTQYDAIHLVTHGADGAFVLNGSKISADNFNEADWAAIGSHLNTGGDILLYGCNLAESEAGQQLVDRIALASGADVAASTDTTGLNGNWDLEYNTGLIETASIQVDGYAHDLESKYITVNSAADDANAGDGIWTLRKALNTAAVDSGNDYFIDFNISGTNTIALGDTLSITNSNVTISIDGMNNGSGEAIILEGGGKNILSIAVGCDVTVENLTFQHGAQGIVNAGTLSVNNSVFTGNTGAAIQNNGGTAEIANSTFINNGSAVTSSGGGSAYLLNSVVAGSGNQLSGVTQHYVIEGSTADLIANTATGELNRSSLAAYGGTRTARDGGKFYFMENGSWKQLSDSTQTSTTVDTIDIGQNGVERNATELAYTAGAWALEVQDTPSLTVTTAQDTDMNPFDGMISLREALAYAGSDSLLASRIISPDGRYKIVFDIAGSSSSDFVIQLNASLGDLVIGGGLGTKTLIIDGLAHDKDGNSRANTGDEIMWIVGDGNTLFKTDGAAGNWNIELNYLHFDGVGIQIAGSTADVIVDTITVENSSGMAVSAAGALALQIMNSTFAENTGAGVSAVSAGGAVTANILNSTIGENGSDGIRVSGNASSRVNLINATIAGNNGTGISLADGTLKIYNSILLGNAVADFGNDNGNTSLTASIYGDGTGAFSTSCGCIVIDCGNKAEMLSVFQTVSENNGRYLPVRTADPGELIDTYNLRPGTDPAGPSIAGGIGQWIKYTLNEDGRITSLAASNSISSGFTVFWGTAGATDISMQLTFDQCGISYATGQPFAGAYFVAVETPSLIVDTHKDVVNRSDNKTSLREALAYAKTFNTPVTITFDYEKLSAEALDDPSMRYILVIGTDGVFSVIDLEAALTIDGSLTYGLGITITAQGNSNIFNVAGNTNLTLKNMHLTEAATVVAAGDNVKLAFEQVTVRDSQYGVTSGSGITLTGEYSSFYGFSSGAFDVNGTMLLHNSTVGGSIGGTISRFDAYNATIKGNVTVTKLVTVNSIVQGTVTASEISARYSAFSGNVAVTDGYANTGDILSADIVVSTNPGDSHYTISSTSVYAKTGTLIVKSEGAYYFAVRTATGIEYEDPDTWKYYNIDTDAEIGLVGSAVITDQIGHLRNPHPGMLSMGAWQATDAVAWKGVEDVTLVNRNNYYSVMQTGVNYVDVGTESTRTDGNQTLYLWATTISGARLSSNGNDVSINKDITIIGRSYRDTVLVGGNSGGTMTIGTAAANVSLHTFSIMRGGADGIASESAGKLSLNRISILGNTGNGISLAGTTELHVLNSTIANNGAYGITGAAAATLYVNDSTITGNASGGIGAAAASAYILNSIVFANGGTDLAAANLRMAYSIYGGTPVIAGGIMNLQASNPADIFYSYSNGKAGYSPDGRTIRILYNSDAGFKGTKVGSDGSNYYYYVREATAFDEVTPGNIGKWQSLTVATVLDDASTLSVFTTDQRGVTRLAGEHLGFPEYSIGAYVPSFDMSIQLMDQETTYNGKAQGFDMSKAVYKVSSGATNDFYYYDALSRMVYTDAALENEATNVKFNVSVVATQLTSGLQVNVKYTDGAVSGYDYVISNARIMADGSDITESFKINYIGDGINDAAGEKSPTYTILQRQLTYEVEFDPTKVYDGTTAIEYSNFRFTNVINGEVTIAISAMLEYSSRNVGTDINLVLANFALVGSKTAIGNYKAPAGGTYKADITPRIITVEISNGSGTYNGSTRYFSDTTAKVSADSPNALVAGDTLDASGLTVFEAGQAHTSSKDVGTYTFILANAKVNDGNNSGNYIIQYKEATYTINKAVINVNLTAKDKIYDGTTDVINGLVSDEFNGVNGEKFTIDSFTGTYDSANVNGNELARTIAFSNIALSSTTGALESNYNIRYTGSGVITRKAVTVSDITEGVNQYDGNSTVHIGERDTYTLTGLVGAEDLTLTGSGTAQTIIDVNQTTDNVIWNHTSFKLHDSSGIANNYYVANTTEISTIAIAVTIEKCDIDLSFSANRDYDRTTDALNWLNLTATQDGVALTVSAVRTAGQVVFTITTDIVNMDSDVGEYETFTITVLNATYNSNAAGTDKVVNVSDLTFANGDNGAELKNYNFNLNSTGITTDGDSTLTLTDTFTGTGKIDRLIVSVSNSATKVYDGSNAANSDTIWGNWTYSSELLALDGVSFALGSGTFNTADVHSSGNMTVTGTLSGAASGNYTLASVTGTGAITPKTITIGDLTAVTKAYDAASNNAKLAGDGATNSLTVSGIGAESFNLTFSGGDYDNANADDGHEVTFSGGQLTANGTAKLGNYEFVFGNDTLTVSGVGAITESMKGTGNITCRDLTVNFTADNKVYDASTDADRIGDFIIVGLQGGETLLIDSSGYTYAFADKNVGNGKTVTLNGYNLSTLSGTNLDNYNLIFNTTTTANITAYEMVINVSANDKTYDGGVAATAGKSFDNLFGDDLDFIWDSASFASKDVAYSGDDVAAQLVSLLNARLTGSDAGNYTFVYGGAITAKITPLAIDMIAAVRDKVYDGNNSAEYNNQWSVENQQIAALLGADGVAFNYLTGTFASRDVFGNEAAQNVSVTGELTGGLKGNYALNSISAAATITRATLSVHAADNAATYGDVVAHSGHDYFLTGFVNGEDAASAGVDGSVTLTDDYAQYDNVGIYGISVDQINLLAGNYKFVAGNDAVLTINKLGITVTANSGQGKVYGQADSALTYQITTTADGSALDHINAPGGFADLIGSLERTTGENASSYAIARGSITDIDNSNYDITYVGADYVIAKAVLQVNAIGGSATYGDAVDHAGYDYFLTGFVNGEDTMSAGISGSVLLSDDYDKFDNAGQYLVSVDVINLLAQNYTFAIGDTAALMINKLGITVTADAGQGKVYGNADSAFTYQITNTADGSNLNHINSSGGYADLIGTLTRAAGENVNSYSILQGSLDNGNNLNYDITFAGTDFAIAKRFITITGDAVDNEYNGSNHSVSFNDLAGSDLVSGDSIADAIFSGSWTGKNVADSGSYSVDSIIIMNGTENVTGNYDFNLIDSGNSFTISHKAITVTGDAVTNEYNGGNHRVNYGNLSADLVTGDAITSAIFGSNWTGKNVVDSGSYSIDSITIMNGAEDVTDNYSFNLIDSGNSFTISRKAITVIGDAVTNEYNGVNHSANLSDLTANGLITGDSLSNAIFGGNWTGKNVADSGNYSVDRIVIMNGNEDVTGNYDFNLIDSGNSFTISHKAITVTGDVVSNEYNGSHHSANLSDLTANGLITGDSLADAIFGGNWTGKNVADSGNYSVDRIVIMNGNEDVTGNYDFNLIDSGNSFTISHKAITVTGDAVANEYDGANHSANLSDLTANGLITGDGLADAIFGGNWTGKNVADSGSYSVDRIVIMNGNEDVTGNYSFNLADSGNSFTVTPKTVIINTSEVVNEYNGNVHGVDYSHLSADGLIAGDKISGASFEAACEGINVCDSGTYQVCGITIANSAEDVTGNYRFDLADCSNAFTITRRTVVVIAGCHEAVEGAPEPVFSYVFDNHIEGDLPTGDLVRESGRLPGSYGIGLGTLSFGDNYDIVFVSGTFTVTPAPANADPVNFDTTMPTLQGLWLSADAASGYSAINPYAMGYSELMTLQLFSEWTEPESNPYPWNYGNWSDRNGAGNYRVPPAKPVNQKWMNSDNVYLEVVPVLYNAGSMTNSHGFTHNREIIWGNALDPVDSEIRTQSDYVADDVVGEDSLTVNQNIDEQFRFIKEPVRMLKSLFSGAQSAELADPELKVAQVIGIPAKVQSFKDSFDLLLDEMLTV